ncbi:hypothetical protein [Fortiea contorta]|uniref:hypothetical protein n=1 Tax=Fortiea contorta TaxID=1892405 RepID=UPI00034B5DB2|nr:hypothetical protein [Fortiea contorta]
MKTNFDEVYYINGRQSIKLTSFAKIVNYSDVYLLQVIKNLFKKSIYIAYKWKRNYYVFIPKKPLKSELDNFSDIPVETIETPSGDNLDIDWQAAISYLPVSVANKLLEFQFNFLIQDKKIYLVSASRAALSSTLTPKKVSRFIPLNSANFPATTDYKYGYYIFYKDKRMSTFAPGTSGTLKSTQIPAAFFEVCRALDAAENLRNGSNPGLPPKRNLSTTISFDTGTVAIAATLPVTTTIQTSGSIDIVASDYLGSTYSAFVNGGGSLKSDTLPEALLEIASILAAAEKAVTPAENQPNNVQIQFDIETGSATISANLPFTTLAAANGDVTIHAIDYL